MNNLIKNLHQSAYPCRTDRPFAGIVNRSIKELISEGYLMKRSVRRKRHCVRQRESAENAIILAAGFGMRMVPINTETPKDFWKSRRAADRAHNPSASVGITEIYVVVGFMKEQYEYLIDEYGVELIVAPDYVSKNNLHSENGGSPFIKQLHHSL